jgi:hypothetical protein
MLIRLTEVDEMRRLLGMWLVVVMIGLLGGSAFAISLLDATKPKNSDLISTFAPVERETRTKVNTLINVLDAPDNATTVETYAEWYGAEGDNATDDTAAFALAIADMGDGEVLRLANGRSYKVNIDIIDKSITIKGNGGQCAPDFSIPGLYPYVQTKPVIKVSSTSASVMSPVNIYDLAIHGNRVTSQIGVHFGPGSYGSKLINSCVEGFIKDNVMIGDYADMSSPITSIDIIGTSIFMNNDLGNAIRLQTGTTHAGTNNWITGIRVSNALLVKYAYTMTEWNDLTAYSANAIVKATDDHDPDNSTADWGFVWKTSGACVSGATEPAWGAPTIGGTVSDGTCTWTTYQRGRLIVLDGTSIQLDISDSYLEPSHFGGIRWNYGWCLLKMANVQLADGGGDDVYLESRYDAIGAGRGTDELFDMMYGDVYNIGYWKPYGQKARSTTPWGASGYHNISYAFGAQPSFEDFYVYPRGVRPSPMFLGSHVMSTDGNYSIDASEVWPAVGKKNLWLQRYAPGDVRIGRADTYSDPKLILGATYLWNYNSKLRYKVGAPSSDTDGLAFATENHSDSNSTQASTYDIGTTDIVSITGAGNTSFGGNMNIVRYSAHDTLASAQALFADVENTDNGTITAAIGLWGHVGNSSTGTISSAKGLVGSIGNSSTGTITDTFGLYLVAPTNTGGGTLTNIYGLYIDSLTAGGTNYSIYTNKGIMRFGDNSASTLLGFFGATPVTQQTELTDELTTMTVTSPAIPDYASDNGTIGFSTVNEFRTAIKVIANLQTRVNELETKLTAYGLLVDAD